MSYTPDMMAPYDELAAARRSEFYTDAEAVLGAGRIRGADVQGFIRREALQTPDVDVWLPLMFGPSAFSVGYDYDYRIGMPRAGELRALRAWCSVGTVDILVGFGDPPVYVSTFTATPAIAEQDLSGNTFDADELVTIHLEDPGVSMGLSGLVSAALLVRLPHVGLVATENG